MVGLDFKSLAFLLKVYSGNQVSLTHIFLIPSSSSVVFWRSSRCTAKPLTWFGDNNYVVDARTHFPTVGQEVGCFVEIGKLRLVPLLNQVYLMCR